jgi:hypothetical protein
MVSVFLLDLSPSVPVLSVGAIFAAVGAFLAIGLLAVLYRGESFHPIPDPEAERTPGTAKSRGRLRRRGNCVQIRARLDGDEIPGWVVDRSQGGLRLQLPYGAALDEVLEVRAVGAPEGTPWVEVRVRYCRQLQPTHWAVGCAFVRTPPWGVLLLFG